MKDGGKRALRIFRTKKALDGFMAWEWAVVCRRAVARSGQFTAALSGGATPVSFYERLAAPGRDLPWDKTYIFQADERCVPSDHPDSNFGLIETKLLRHVPIPQENIYAVRAELGPEAAAAEYDARLRDFFGSTNGEIPRFDLILLGIGEDGHTASLFPGDAALTENRRLAAAVSRGKPGHDRVTLTLSVIRAAKVVAFLIAGANKAAIVKSVIEAPKKGVPAAQARSSAGRTLYLADKDAASLLGRRGLRSAGEHIQVLR